MLQITRGQMFPQAATKKWKAGKSLKARKKVLFVIKSQKINCMIKNACFNIN